MRQMTLSVLASLGLGAGTAASAIHDFDFLIGHTWNVKNRVLEKRLSGSNEWTEWDAALDDVRKIAGGYGNVDRFKAVLGGEPFEGNSLRLFDPKTDTWTIYWVDSRNPELRKQVTGGFENGVAEFFGEELYQGKTVKMRFIWSDITPSSARWEQAYLDASSGEWETNWIMEFTKAP